MDAKIDDKIQILMDELFENLRDQSETYSRLLEIVKTERTLLISANIDDLQKSNLQKETIIYKLRGYDIHRERIAKDVSDLLKCEPRLLKIAEKVSAAQSTELKRIHKELDQVISKIVEQNKENEIYAQSGLKMMNGALDEIRGTLSGKPTYARHGKSAYGPEKSGNIVSKEA